MYDMGAQAEADRNWTAAIRETERLGQETHGMFRERAVIEQESVREMPTPAIRPSPSDEPNLQPNYRSQNDAQCDDS